MLLPLLIAPPPPFGSEYLSSVDNETLSYKSTHVELSLEPWSLQDGYLETSVVEMFNETYWISLSIEKLPLLPPLVPCLTLCLVIISGIIGFTIGCLILLSFTLPHLLLAL